MKIPRLEIRTTRHVADKDGRSWLTFTPVFLPDVTAGGELTFACYQRAEDDPGSHEEAKAAALENARRCLALFSAALPPVRDDAAEHAAALAWPEDRPPAPDPLPILERMARAAGPNGANYADCQEAAQSARDFIARLNGPPVSRSPLCAPLARLLKTTPEELTKAARDVSRTHTANARRVPRSPAPR